MEDIKKNNAAKKSTTAKKAVADTAAKTEDKKVASVKTTEKKAAAKPVAKTQAPKAEEAKAQTAKKSVAKAKEAVEKELNKKGGTAKKSVLFVGSEAGPFIRSGGLGDVMEALPKAMLEENVDARVMIPLYHDISAELRQTMKYVGSVYVTLAWRYQYCGVFQVQYNGVTYYLLDNEYYFKRNGIYGHYDDAERFAFFSKACLEVLAMLNFYPSVIHANDWQTALVPVFLDAFYRHINGYKDIKTVFTIHNIQFQGKYGKELLRDILGMPLDKTSWVEYANCVNFMKGGIERANAVTTVSRTYATEIKDSYFSYGLDGILNTRSYKLSGIVNGIDTVLYDPMTDPALFKNFSAATIEDREVNKKGLLELANLPYDKNRPVIGMVTRLTEQKGLDLVMRVIEDILAKDVQLIVLGKGDWKYENAFTEIQSRYPNKLRIFVSFSQDIASKIYAGADMFLMPSKFEPCGLSQMIAMRYGCVPIVREVGGLKDTVAPYNPESGVGSGFTFYSYNAYDMLDAVCRALGVYYVKENWNKVVANGMAIDFSWSSSAKAYIQLYERL